MNSKNLASALGSAAALALVTARILITGAVGCLLLSGCSGGSSSADTTPVTTNPVPSISSLAPSTTPAGGAAFTLTVNGANFISSSVVRWNGNNRATTFVSSTQLTASIGAADVLSAGATQVTVVNPAPGGGISNLATFTIAVPPNPVPAITSLSPSGTPAGGAPFPLTVNGTNFLQSSVVQWNGSSRTTTFVSSTQLTASIALTDIAAAGTAQVTVVNPAPGGGTSSGATFTVSALISNPVPTISSLAPASVTAELTGFALTVTGTGFTGSSVGQWNGANRATVVVSSTLLLLAPLPADNATTGNALVTVVNPAPGGGTSSSMSIAVNSLAANAIGVTDRLSVANDSTEANGDNYIGAISADGRFIAFYSDATDLVAGDTNATWDSFVRDTCRGAAAACTPAITRVSIASDGSQGNDVSYNPHVSANGRFVAFESPATNLVAGDTNDRDDIFVRDTCVGASGCTPSTVRVSVSNDGSQGNDASYNPYISADGRFVAFDSAATNLVAGDTNKLDDIFVRDTCVGASGCTPSTIRVSIANDGSQASDISYSPVSISADGRFIAFESVATNLVAGDTNGASDIFVRDTCVGASGCTPSTVRVSVDSAGTQGNNSSFLPSISGNGRFVAFTSFATNLVANDTNNGHDVFMRDTCFGAAGSCTPSTVRVSVDSNGNQANTASGGPATGGASISADGRYVAFGSRATNLVSGDTNGTFDIFVRDTCVGASGCTPATTRVTVALDGTESLNRSDDPVISADGRFVAFDSLSTAFLPGDTNSSSDVFLARTGKP